MLLKKKIKILSIILSIGLLLLSLYSDYKGNMNYKKFMLYKTSEYKVLNSRNKSLESFKYVTKQFNHGIAEHTLESNWIMFLLGNINRAFGTVYMHKNFFKSKRLICSQSSYLLLKLLEEDNIKTRHVSFYSYRGGHVIMEAWFNGKWNMFDPDYKVVPYNNNLEILSVNELIIDSKTLYKYYEYGSVVSKLFLEQENHSYVAYPEGSYFEWKTNVLKYYEELMEVLKYLLLIGYIFFMWRRL